MESSQGVDKTTEATLTLTTEAGSEQVAGDAPKTPMASTQGQGPPAIGGHTHHNCQHHHQHQSNSNSMQTNTSPQHQYTHGQDHQHHHQHAHYNHQHQPTCKFYSNHPGQLKPPNPESYSLNPIPDLSVSQGVAESVLKYLRGDLHRTWTLLSKLDKAKLVDKKLEGVFILKQLGLNKGVTALKCLTNNTGDISKTLEQLAPKQLGKQIKYLSSLPEQEYFVLIDGLSLAVCDDTIREMCLSNKIEQRHIAIIRMYMFIEICPGVFLIPHEYLSQQVIARIKQTVTSMKTKPKQPIRLQLFPLAESLETELVKTLKFKKPEERKKLILVTGNTDLLWKVLEQFPQVRAMEGKSFFQEVTKTQDKQFIDQLISFK